MGKSPCCSDEKVELKKGPWTPEEDQKLTDYIQKHGHGRWRTLPNNAGLKRCGKSCRLRWINYLRPDIKRGRFSLEEEDTIIQLHSVLGNKWSTIASHLPGRTDNEIKNYWNTIIRKKLLKMGIDPVTHAPCLDLLELSSLLSSALIYNNLSSYQLNTDLPNHHDQLGINHYNNPLFKHPQVVQNSSSILQLQNNHISDVQTTATSTGLGQLISQNLSNLLSSYSPNSYLWQNNTSEASITPNYESFIVPLQQNHSYKDLVTTPSSNPLNSNSPTNYVNCSSTTTEGERDSFYHNILMYDISTDLNHTNQHYNN